MTTCRWLPLGAALVLHLDVSWSPTCPGSHEPRHEPLCGMLLGPYALLPGGERECIACRRLMEAAMAKV